MRFLASLLLCGQLSAATYYVATTGNDTTGDGSSGTPWATLDKALSYASLTGGDTISIGAGDFSAAANTDYSGSDGNPITITGQGTNSTFIKGTFTLDENYYVVTDLTVARASLALSTATNVFLKNLWITKSQYPVTMSLCGSLTFSNCVVNAGFGEPMFNLNGSDILLVSNLIYQSGGADIHRANGTSNVVWRGNTYKNVRDTYTPSGVTSSTSLAIGTGDKTFTVSSSSMSWITNDFLVASSQANTANNMSGWVKSYSGTTLVLEVTGTGGSGTFSDWSIDSINVGNHVDIVQVFDYTAKNNIFEGCYVTNSAVQWGNITDDLGGNSTNWVFRNNIFHNSRFQLNTASPTTQFYNNTFYNTSFTTGLYGYNVASGDGTPIYVYNNIFCRVGDTESSGVYIAASADYNLITDTDDTSKTGYSESNGINGGYTPAEIFTDVSIADFSLVAGSPAIAAGTNLYSAGLVLNDFNGTARTTTMDIGAIAYTTGGDPPAEVVPTAVVGTLRAL